MKTAGRWPWKPVSAKKCVTAYLPNEPALKMDDAKACCLPHAVTSTCTTSLVGGRGSCGEAYSAMMGGAAASADLGSSSKFFEEWPGARVRLAPQTALLKVVVEKVSSSLEIR